MSHKIAKAVLVKRKHVQEEKKEPTFPALYQHQDGSIFLFTDKTHSICLTDNDYENPMTLGENYTLFSYNLELVWTRLPSNKAIKLFNQ